MTVLFQVAALHHQSLLAAIIALAATIHNGPGYPITDSQRLISGIVGNLASLGSDGSHDFVSQNYRNKGRASSGPGMNVGTTDGATGHFHQYAVFSDLGQGIMLYFEILPWGGHHGCSGGFFLHGRSLPKVSESRWCPSFKASKGGHRLSSAEVKLSRGIAGPQSLGNAEDGVASTFPQG
jgi:hypothetical protein